MMRIDYAEIIKNRLTIEEVIEAYVSNAKRGRAPCPFHNGKDLNLGYRNGTYHCFVCHEKGDVIEFVKKYFSLSFVEAIRKLNDDFSLGLALDSKEGSKQKECLLNEMSDIVRKRKEAEKEEKEYKALWKRLITEWQEVNAVLKELRPKKGDETLDPRFVKALDRYPQLEFELDECMRNM